MKTDHIHACFTRWFLVWAAQRGKMDWRTGPMKVDLAENNG